MLTTGSIVEKRRPNVILVSIHKINVHSQYVKTSICTVKLISFGFALLFACARACVCVCVCVCVFICFFYFQNKNPTWYFRVQ